MSALAYLKEFEPLIQLLTLIFLVVYVIDTRRIRRASVAQASALHQPCLVLEQKLREPMRSILDSIDGPAPTTELASPLTLQNIGTGPAIQITWRFSGLTPPMEFSVPYLLAGQRCSLALGQNTVTTGQLVFEARYSSIAGQRFLSSQPLSSGHLGVLAVAQVPGA
jgi:hypothetical protein